MLDQYISISQAISDVDFDYINKNQVHLRKICERVNFFEFVDYLSEAGDQYLLHFLEKLLKSGHVDCCEYIVSKFDMSKLSKIRMNAHIIYLYYKQDWIELAKVIGYFNSQTDTVNLLSIKHQAKCVAKLIADNDIANINYYSITLDEKSQRFKRQKRQFELLGIDCLLKCWIAIDGRKWPSFFKKKFSMSGMQIALGLSHMSIWEDILSNKFDVAVVLEDDAHLLYPIPSSLVDAAIASDLDIIWLTERRNRNTIVDYSNKNFAKIDFLNINPKDPGTGTEGYLLTKKGASKLYNLYEKLIFSRKDADIDVFMTGCTLFGEVNQNLKISKDLSKFYSRTINLSCQLSDFDFKTQKIFPWAIEHRDNFKSIMRDDFEMLSFAADD